MSNILRDKILAELKTAGPAKAGELANILDESLNAILKQLRGLREDGLLIVTSGVYRLHDEDVNKRVPGSAIKGRKVLEAKSVNTDGKDELLTGNGAQVNYSGVCLPVIATLKNENITDDKHAELTEMNIAKSIDSEIAVLKAKIEQKPIEIKNLELKLDVLKKLEPLLSGDIGAVLLDVVDDLQAIQGAA